MVVRNYASFLLFGFFLLLIVDSVVLSRKIKRKVAERFPDGDDKTRGLVWYGISRATMIRRWRFPKPDVAAGRRRLGASGGRRTAPNVAVRGIQTPRPLRPDHLRDRLRQLAHPRQPGRGGRRARLRERRPRRRHHHLRHRRRLRRHQGRVRARPRAGRPAPLLLRAVHQGLLADRPRPERPRASAASTSSRAATPPWSGCRPTTSTSTRPTATTRRCRSRRR